MYRTRVGYTGGREVDPTYHDMGGHTESLQVDFDPEVLPYDEIVRHFWESHTPTAPRWSVQYKAALFVHDERQRDAAEASAERVARALGARLTTEVLPLTPFYRAEDYHQKYRLRRHGQWTAELQARYPNPDDFTDSTAAARLNGLLAGHTVRIPRLEPTDLDGDELRA